MKKTIIIGCLFLILILLFIGGFAIKRFLEIDSCLDSGGSWNYDTNKIGKNFETKTR